MNYYLVQKDDGYDVHIQTDMVVRVSNKDIENTAKLTDQTLDEAAAGMACSKINSLLVYQNSNDIKCLFD